MFENVVLDPLVLESGAAERIGHAGVHADPEAAAGHIPTELQIVARGDPGAANRDRDRLGLAENAVAVDSPVITLARTPQSTVEVTLSMMTSEGASMRMLVSCLRSSSASVRGVTSSAVRPVRMSAISSARRVLPVPCVVASNRASGTGPLMM